MKNKMKKLLSYILLTLTLGLVSCSEDEPNNPVRDYIQYNCIDVTFNDNVLTEHPNIISWNNRYQLEDDFIKSWYTDYFIGSTLTFRNSGEILFNSFEGQESMYGIKQADSVTIPFIRLNWENQCTGEVLMRLVDTNTYECKVTDKDIGVTFNLTFKYEEEETYW